MEDMQQLMLSYKEEAERELKLFFESKLNSKDDAVVRPIVEMIRDFTISGGKRIRPILVMSAHDLFAEHNRNIAKAAASFEISQSYFLIQDDVMDQSSMRRGKSSFHIDAWRRFFNNDPELRRIADNISIIAGDMAESYSHQVLLESDFPAERLLEANSELSKVFETTGEGQLVDVMSPFMEEFTATDLMRLHMWKTSNYTVAGPLRMGTILSGNTDYMNEINSFGSLVGVAFQIQDDILGLFGDEKTVGKSAKSDVNEGKRTLLMLKALENGSTDERKFIFDVLRSGNVSDQEFLRVRKIVEETGSLDFSVRISSMLVDRGKKYLEKINGDSKILDFLNWVADYLIKRKY